MELKRGIVLALLVMIFFVSSVSALDACCERTSSGEWCIFTDQEQCDSNYLSTNTGCEQTSYCQVGTCFTSDDGTCFANTPRATCEDERGTTWSSDSIDDIPQCQLGCCTIADQAFYVTEVKCKSVGSQYEDALVDFDPTIPTEAACLSVVKNKDLGCCVQGDSASFVTREECGVGETEPGTNLTIEGFHENVLCSNDLLNTDCAKQQTTGCYQGKIYWYDSCGNRENIYSTDARKSYNSGYVLKEIDSCTASSPNDPTCGNCDYGRGMTCGEDTLNVMAVGDVACVDLNCGETFEHDASPLSGQSRLNGESWCIFDSRPGEGMDAVGSRHYRHLCINGEEVTESCADFREELCINGILSQDTLSNLESLNLDPTSDYVEAACRENRNECSPCNDPETGMTERFNCCTDEDARDCFWTEDVRPRTEEELKALELFGDDETSAGICLPQVPPGLKFWSDTGAADDVSSSSVCSEATTECTATWRIGGTKNIFGRRTRANVNNWKMLQESPDGCTSKEWLVQQNTVCKSLGDCGAYFNYIGDAGYDGLTSTLLDEQFFFDVDELEASDLGDWDYLSNIDDVDEGAFVGFHSQKLIKNPATYIGLGSMLIGGITGAVKCNAADTAQAAADVARKDLKATQALSTLAGGVAAPVGLVGGALESYNTATPDVKKCYHTHFGDCASLSKAGRIDNDANKEYRDCLKIGGKLAKYNICVDEAEAVAGSGGITEEEIEKKCESEKVAYENKECSTLSGGLYAGCTEEARNVEQRCIGRLSKSPENPLLAPQVPYRVDTKPTATTALQTGQQALALPGTLSEAKGTLKETLGRDVSCGIGSAIPLLGLFGKKVDKGIKGDALLEASEAWTKISKSIKTAKTAGTISKVANVASIAAVAYLAVEYGFQNETTMTYTAECNLWQPPAGGENCEECNNPNTPCSEYKCKSLGASCDIINVGTENETCVSLNANDVNSPIITPISSLLNEDLTLKEVTEEGNKGFEIQEKIKAFTPIQLAINTDEPAQCKYTTTPDTEFEDMNSFFGQNMYLYNHSILFSLGDEVTEEQIIAVTEGVHTVYVRCADSIGNANERDYFIRFTVDTTPDLTPPEVAFTSVTSGSYMQYELDTLNFAVYTNEPSTCRWANNDTGYQFMGGEMKCPTSGFQQSSAFYGTYECSTTLTGVSNSEINNYYFRCEDQSGNINENSFKFVTKSTESPLEITSVGPSGLFYGTDLMLEVETNKGAENGQAECRFSLEDVGYNGMIPFLNSNSSMHTQPLKLIEGEYTYYIACQDIAGNRAENKTEISIDIDTGGPTIEEVYVDTAFNVLFLRVSEESTCEYANTAFTFGEGTSMTGDGLTEHEASLEALEYNIICEDTFGNFATYLVDLTALI